MGALDSAATGHFLPENYEGTNHQSTPNGIRVGCANGSVMRAVATDHLDLRALPIAARKAHKFRTDEIAIPLISVPQLCESNMTVLFSKNTVTVKDSTGKQVLEGKRDTNKNLFMVPITDTKRPLAPQAKEKGNRAVERGDRVEACALAASAYTQKTVPLMIAFLHAAAGYPRKQTWLRAIEAGYFDTWPGITAQRVRRYLIEPDVTTLGHQKMISSNIRSTKNKKEIKPKEKMEDEKQQTSRDQFDEEPLPPPTSPRSSVHDVGVYIVDAHEATNRPELKNLIASDLPGRYPITSARGHKYLFVMYDFDSNYINAVPIKSRKSCELVRGFTECYELLKKNGLTARMLRLDNEVSKELIATIENNELTYQLASPGDHRLNHAERAIQTFKAHFITIRSGADPDFPPNCWDLLVDQAVLSLNLHRPSRINPKISAYTQIHGAFNYNKTPLAPAGCKVIVHDRIDDRGTWSEHGTRGYYIGPALHHYRNYECYMPATKAKRTSNTIAFFPEYCKMPTTSSTDRLTMILADLLEVLQHPHPAVPFLQQGTELNEAIRSLQTLLFLDQDQSATATRVAQRDQRPRVQPLIETSVAPPAPQDKRMTRATTARTHDIGTIIKKKFNDGKIYEGEVHKYDPINKFYGIAYRDGDKEEFTHDEVTAHRKKTQRYSSQLKVRPLAFKAIGTAHRHRLSIPTKANPTPNLQAHRPTVQPIRHHAHAAGAIWDPELNKMASYRDLIRHPNKEIRDRWNKSGVNEFARLLQGYGDIEGMNVLEIIHKHQVPTNKIVTYARYTVANRPEKAEPARTRITAGGDRLHYDGAVSTDSASMETIKCHWNSVVSTTNAKYCTGDISNMYLESWLKDSEYVRFELRLIPQAIIDHYNLNEFAVAGYVYAKVNKAWYGLMQSGRIAHDDLVAHLAKHDYVKTKHTEGLFRHKTRDISFTLVVDDFGIKYTNTDDVDHLNHILRKKYKYKVDMEGKQYIGIHLKWDYEKREVICSMDGYVEQALQEFTHAPPNTHFNGPSKVVRPDYGAKIQYVKDDTTKPLNKTKINYLQRVVGKFLYYARAIDNTMLHALNDIATATSKGTEATLAAVEYFLNYAASNPDARIRYIASEMILQAISDAAYLVCPNARSRMGGYHFLGNKDRKLFNGPLLVLAKVIKNVMSSAAESEVGGLYMNAREDVPIRTTLIEMGHPQPATPLTTDNNTAEGILNGTIKQKRSKAIDMRFNWLKDRVARKQFTVHWEPGKYNLADYPSKHHAGKHHRKVRDIYLYNEHKSPKTMQGCVTILDRD